MKKYILSVLALCLVLSGCGKDAQETTAATQQTTKSTVATTEATTVPTTAATKPTEGLMDLNPLTGEKLDKPNDNRPYAIMLNNHHVALPHHGVGAADVVYETCVEGGMTRFMAIFSDPAKAGPIGSVRSARPPFLDIVQGYDAIYSSASADDSVLSVIESKGLDYLNGLTSSYFYRDSWRADNVGFEHSLFVKGEDLVNFAKDESVRQTHKENQQYGFIFDDQAAFDGKSAKKITISFQDGGKETLCNYDEKLKAYTLNEYDMDYVDGNTDELVPFRNILVLNANRWVLSNGIHVQMDTVGEGTGYYARDGKIVPIKWSRKDVDSPFAYTYEDGKPVNFGVGKTYVAVIQDGAPVEFE